MIYFFWFLVQLFSFQLLKSIMFHRFCNDTDQDALGVQKISVERKHRHTPAGHVSCLGTKKPQLISTPSRVRHVPCKFFRKISPTPGHCEMRPMFVCPVNNATSTVYRHILFALVQTNEFFKVSLRLNVAVGSFLSTQLILNLCKSF